MINNFMGKNGFVWWVGVVENRNDPLKLGSLRVRIVGWHSESLTDMPSEKLPWAPVTMPVTHSRASIDVKEGEMVFGFFMDGMAGQYPVVMGVFPGVKSIDENSSAGFSPQLTAEQKQQLPVAPEDVVLGASQKNEPTTPRISQGKVEGTLIAQTNKELVHVCDFATAVKRDVAWEKLKNGQIIGAIRRGLDALIELIGKSPDGFLQWIIETAKWFRRKIKILQDLIEEVNAFLTYVNQFAAVVRALIDWILSLPARIQAFLSVCLSNLLNSGKQLLNDLISLPGGSVGTSLKEIEGAIGDTSKLIDTAKETVTVGTSIITTLTTPGAGSSSSDVSNQLINQFVDSVNSTVENKERALA